MPIWEKGTPDLGRIHRRFKLFNRSSGTGSALGLSWKVSPARKVVVILLAVLLAAALIFAVIGPSLDGASINADAESSTVVAGWSFDGYGGGSYGGGGPYGSLRAGPSWG